MWITILGLKWLSKPRFWSFKIIIIIVYNFWFIGWRFINSIRVLWSAEDCLQILPPGSTELTMSDIASLRLPYLMLQNIVTVEPVYTTVTLGTVLPGCYTVSDLLMQWSSNVLRPFGTFVADRYRPEIWFIQVTVNSGSTVQLKYCYCWRSQY